MKYPFYAQKSFLTPDFCDEIIRIGESFNPTSAKIGNEASGSSQSDYRRSKVAFFHRGLNPTLDRLFYQLLRLFSEANSVAFDVDIRDLREVQFTKYEGIDKGHYDWHKDNWFHDSPRAFDRKLSVVVQLSERSAYEGGDLLVNVNSARINSNAVAPGRGDAIVFPSFFDHKVEPLTSGLRYSLVSWVEGPPWR